MAAANDNRPLKDCVASSEEEPHSIKYPFTIEANSFKLKPSLLQIVQQNQFSGNLTKDPNLHVLVFVQYANTLKCNGMNGHMKCNGLGEI